MPPPIANKQVLVQIIAWRRGDKSSYEPMVTQFTVKAYMQHYGEMS